MQLEGTAGQRLGVYLAEPGTPDYDAMVLLDMTAPQHAAKAIGSVKLTRQTRHLPLVPTGWRLTD